MGKFVVYGLVVVALSSLVNWVNLGRSAYSGFGSGGSTYYGGTHSSGGGGGGHK